MMRLTGGTIWSLVTHSALGVKDLSDFAKVPSSRLKAVPTDDGLNELHKLLYAEAAKLDDGKTARDQIFKGKKLKAAYFEEILKLNATDT